MMVTGTEDLLVGLQFMPFCYFAKEIYAFVLLDLFYLRERQPIPVLLDYLAPVCAHVRTPESLFASAILLLFLSFL
jgi:hypothetical protein